MIGKFGYIEKHKDKWTARLHEQGNILMKSKTILILFISFLIIKFLYYNYFFINMVKGIYINTNYEKSNGTDIPNQMDTLILFENNTFKSNYWGNGRYKLVYSYRGTELNLFYQYQFGKGVFKAKITREWFSTPKVIIEKDLDHYYKKL